MEIYWYVVLISLILSVILIVINSFYKTESLEDIEYFDGINGIAVFGILSGLVPYINMLIIFHTLYWIINSCRVVINQYK